MDLERSFGILLHPTSLPGPWGIGTLGDEARLFLDWISASGARWWQVLPLGPTGYGDSPYQSFSAFAGNPYLLDPEVFLARGWLSGGAPGAFPEDRVDYGLLYATRWPLLRRAYAGFLGRATRREKRKLAWFAQAEGEWLSDYALFMALKNEHGGAPWTAWPRELRAREPEALRAARGTLREEVGFHAWTQWAFARQWGGLRAYAAERGIGILGDMPIFVSHDSADVWAHPELFHLDPEGNPAVVAGVPPDYFSATGQRWGNPLYRWEVHERDGFSWWLARVRHALQLFDLVRLDHFRGLQAYWEIPAEEPTAVRGRWVEAPGRALLQRIREELGDVPIVAEDLGVITPEVEALRDGFGLPGMRVLQFAFAGGDDNPHLPRNFPDHGRVLVYTGTHDNDTALGWYRSTPPEERERLASCLAQEGIPLRREGDVPWALIELAFRSRARLAVIPLQDVLGLGPETRMNRPAQPSGNWAWRYRTSDLTEEIAHQLRALAERTGRLARGEPLR